MVYIREVHVVGGPGHEHIAEVRWLNPGTSNTGASSRAEMVKFIRDGNEARVRDRAGHEVLVGVIDAHPPYIRTHADGVWTDNLLALPRY